MTRMTLRMLETPPAVLQRRASKEGLSLIQFVLFILTRESALAHGSESLPATQVLLQHDRFHVLLQSLGCTLDDAKRNTFLGQREGTPKLTVPKTVEPEPRSKITNKQKATAS